MSKKQQRSRLENLFSDLAEHETAQNQPLVEPFSGSIEGEMGAAQGILLKSAQKDLLCGWTWEIDSTLKYIDCGQETSQGLGIPAERFVGQSMLSFAIHPKTAAGLGAALAQPYFPVDQDVFFQNDAGQWIPARVHIINRVGPADPTGWQGFTQVLPAGSIPLPDEPALVQVKPRESQAKAPPPTHAKTHELNPNELADPGGMRREIKKSNSKTGPLTWVQEQQGFAVKNGALLPSTQVWTPSGQSSLEKNETAFQNTEEQAPATIAVPFQMQGVGDLLLEVVDDSKEREWSEDDRFLVMEIVGQLALALDNAQLFISAQQELAERVRAEQATLRRNKDLATLNRIGQQLSHLTTRAEIFDLLSSMIGEVLNNDNLYICTFNPIQRTLSFPIFTENKEQIAVPDRPFGNTIPDHVIETKKPLLITGNTGAILAQAGIILPQRVPLSLLAIPLVAGEKAIGAIVIQDFIQENAFDTIHLELLSTAAAQATTALENADLFQQMQNGLEALENRERYQSNVAKAAATLTEFGTRAMPEVLRLLGQATQCSRIYFAQAKEDDHGRYWTSTCEWVDPSVAYLFDKTRIIHIPVASSVNWAQGLGEKGWVVTNSEEEQSHEATFLSIQHIRSSLLLAVPGEFSTPSYVAFEQVSEVRYWQSDEINALRVAADAITNTFIREGLLLQLQGSLDETESLYKASNRLAQANDMQEMVSTVLMDIRTPAVNRAVLLLFENDSFGLVSKISVGANWYSGRGTPPPATGTEFPRARYERFLQTQNPLFIEDVQEAQLDADLRNALLYQNIHGLAVLPLWTGKRQTGVLLVEAEIKYHFSGRETRNYPALADQMAIAVENQRLFEQTQQALSETELLYNLSSRVAQAADVRDMLSLVVENVLPEGANRALLILIESDTNDDLLELELVGYHEIRREYHPLGTRLPVASFPIVKTFTDEPVIIPDLNHYSIDEASRKTLEQHEIRAACLIPLRTSGHLIGVLGATSRSPVEFNPEATRLLRITGNGIAVSLEKQRLLRQAQRRALELQTASEIARDTTSTLSLDLLLNRIVNMLSERFGFYHASIFLLDETETYAVVRESTGEAGREMKQHGHRLAVGSRSVMGTVTATGAPFIIHDTHRDQIYFPNPLLPDTRSEMGVPLKINDKVIGALDLQSRSVNGFNQDDVTVLQILSDQIAIAIENARAYELSQRAIADMKEVDRVKSQFLANMSHELRTPLNSIIGFSRVIIKGIDGPINDIQKQDLSAIYNSGQHLLSLINDILDLSKIEAGKMEMAFGELNLPDMVNSVMSTAIGLVKDKPIQLNTVIPDNLPLVRADSTRVRQVLINFISNAAKFTEQGSITVEVSLVTAPNSNQPEVMLAVTDTGPGIDVKGQGKLFLPFSQVDDSPTRKTGGTGLGLSICRSLIDMHGGRIGLLWSEVGVGSTFYFTLPLNSPPPSTDPESPNTTSNLILAVDDDPKVISLYERFLRQHGYQVIPQTNPNEAVQRAKEIHPFAITLDVMMPGKDGWQVMQDLKNDPKTRDIPIIVCSILENQEKGFSLGAADYLVKPFLQEELIHAMNRLNQDGRIREVLVIDDDPADRRLVQKIVEDNKKYSVKLAEGGKQGWDLIQAGPPDAIVLDLFMPDMNGFTLLEKLRSDPVLQHIPVIVLTGADLTPEQLKLLSEFGQGLLSKGYLSEKELLLSLDEALRKFKPAKE